MRNFKLLSVLLLCMAVVFTSCGTWNNTAKGTAIGVGGGAAVGAGVGALAGNTALGSIIGAAVGGTAGALIGKKMDKQKKELEATLPEETTVETINNGEALKVTFDSGILFATNSSTVSAASKSALRDLAASLNANPDTDIKIIGHTDNTGKVDYNQTLSEKRAKSVFDYLNGTFIRERSSLRTVPLNSLLLSRKSYKIAAFSSLRFFIASRPPRFLIHLNTLPQMYRKLIIFVQ